MTLQELQRQIECGAITSIGLLELQRMLNEVDPPPPNALFAGYEKLAMAMVGKDVPDRSAVTWLKRMGYYRGVESDRLVINVGPST